MYPNGLIKLSRRIYSKFQKNIKPVKETANYFGNPVLSWEGGNDLIFEKITAGKPLMVTRIGHTELTILRNYYEIEELKHYNFIRKFWAETKYKDADWSDLNRRAIHFSSGFFPVTSENLYRFCEIYFESLKQIDALGVWYNYYEDILTHRYCPDAGLIPLQSLEPYYFENPWSRALKDKKVLVVHPFEESIRKQFEKREKLFENPGILPPFKLEIVKAVQGAADHKNEFNSWFEGMEHMKEEIRKKDFDIALIGAGAYGLPLAAYVKSLGKQAIHVGGALQIFFGIIGARWYNIPAISKFFNEHWTKPTPEETPEKHREFEGGTGYW